jgi:hypothetical protein
MNNRLQSCRSGAHIVHFLSAEGVRSEAERKKRSNLSSVASTFGLRSGLRQQGTRDVASIFGATKSRCPDTKHKSTAIFC